MSKSPKDMQARVETKERFGAYRKPTEVTAPKFKAIQEKAQEFALLIEDMCPYSKQKSNALTLLEQCKMSANAAIALHEGDVQPQPVKQTPACPKCGSNELAVERRPEGNAVCTKCNWEGPYNYCFQEVAT